VREGARCEKGGEEVGFCANMSTHTGAHARTHARTPTSIKSKRKLRRYQLVPPRLEMQGALPVWDVEFRV